MRACIPVTVVGYHAVGPIEFAHTERTTINSGKRLSVDPSFARVTEAAVHIDPAVSAPLSGRPDRAGAA